MCEFCTQHGEGKKWYLRAENYSFELMETLKTKTIAHKFATNFNTIMDRGFKALKIVNSMPLVIRRFAYAMHEAWEKKTHFGQVIPIEDVEEVLKKTSSIVRLPCLCRKYFTQKEGRYCIGITMDVMKDDYAEALDRAFYGGPDLHGLEYLTFDEAMQLEKDFDNKGLVHTVWTLPTPLIVSICNCDLKTCSAFRLKDGGLSTVFRAEYIAIVEPDKCIGCGACKVHCHFNAITINKELGKAMIDPALCYGCGVCRTVCPGSAISLIDRRKHALAKELWT